MSLSLPGKGSILQNTFSISNLPRRSSAKFVESDIASTSFEDERIGGTLVCNDELGIFDREKTSSGSFPFRKGVLVEYFCWSFSVERRSGGTLILLSGTSHRYVCPVDQDLQTLMKSV